MQRVILYIVGFVAVLNRSQTTELPLMSLQYDIRVLVSMSAEFNTELPEN